MSISDWSSDVCSSDLAGELADLLLEPGAAAHLRNGDALVDRLRDRLEVTGHRAVEPAAQRLLRLARRDAAAEQAGTGPVGDDEGRHLAEMPVDQDRKSTRLNSSH